MLKLMKYEFRKQMFSKLIILIGIGLLEVYFIFSVIREEEQDIAKAIGIFITAMIIAFFYVGIESINVFNRDLKTKQSYMLYMVPYSTYSIIGAKIIAAFLQILLTGMMFLAGIILNFVIVFAKFGTIKEMFELLKKVLEMILDVQLDFSYLIALFLFIFFLWMMVILSGMFSISLSTTFLANNRFRVPVSVIIFIVLIRLIVWLSDVLLPAGASQWGSGTQLLVSNIYLGIASVLLYIGTAWMLDKKVSV